jgi:signal transduction histidine kinase
MVPVRRENPVAAIGAYWATEHVAGEKELQRLTILADSAALALANVSLYDELAASVARERAAREAAEASLQAKDQFLAVVSHELRQPLHAALSALEVMAMRRNRERGTHARDVVERQLRHMMRIVDDLLESSRIIRGIAEIRREVIDVRQVVLDAVEGAVVNDADRCRLTVDLGHHPLWLSADPARLRQVFQNVLANAIKFSEPDDPICVTATLTDAEIAITVGDRGRGIDAATLPRLFDLFTRGHTTTSGFGIGLAVVRRLVELHSGTVEAHSDGLGTGSTFTIRLPVTPVDVTETT